MPNQQPWLSEHTSCGTSCKNAKDKSNSTTLLAIRGSKDADDSSGKGSSCSSEKDSGYSDGSDWHHMDVEDRRTSRNQSRTSDRAQASQPAQKEQVLQRNPGSVPSIPAGHDLPPICIIKDMVLKQQPSVIQKQSQLLWRNIRENSFSAAPHMIIFQRPGLAPDSLQVHKPSSQRSNANAKNVNNSYIPILNSYPRIAPHPSKKPPDKSSLNSESQSLGKRVCTDLKINDAPVTRGLPEQHFHKQPKSAASVLSSSTRENQSLSASASSNQGFPSVSTLQATSASFTGRGHHKDAAPSARHRRFFNTVEILKQSGLLDITLRTKELLRQSTATDRGIAQLRRHTELLCQAANNPSGIMGWERVHNIMDESCSYPDLKAMQDLQCPCYLDSTSQAESIFDDTVRLEAAETSESLLSATREQDDKLAANDKYTVVSMPPDSSTG